MQPKGARGHPRPASVQIARWLSLLSGISSIGREGANVHVFQG
jgi:hypothetical protein